MRYHTLGSNLVIIIGEIMHGNVQRLRKRKEKTGKREQTFSTPRNSAHWLYIASPCETVLAHFQGSITGKGGLRGWQQR